MKHKTKHIYLVDGEMLLRMPMEMIIDGPTVNSTTPSKFFYYNTVFVIY